MEKLELNLPEVEVFYDKQRDYVKVTYTDAANKVTVEDGYVISKKLFEKILELKPKFILLDHKNLSFPYTNEYREKAAKQLSPMINAAGSVQKIAYVMSNDIITKIGMQLMQEDLLKNVTVSYKRAFFQDVEEAEKWLFS